MPHTCKIHGCNNPVFGGGVCKYHQYERRRLGGDLYLRKPPKAKPIPKESKKRKDDHRQYTQKTKEFWYESVANKTDLCFFCGVHMNKRDNVHHLRGRQEYYLDKEYWVNAHNDCHVNKYHMMDIEQLKKESWYPAFLQRLKAKDPQSYDKELKKQDKVQKLNPNLFGDDDDNDYI
jgi:hypothetical protein